MIRNLITAIFLGISSLVSGQVVFLEQVQTTVDKVEGISLLLEQFEAYGVKDDRSDSIYRTLDWIESMYTDYGYTELQRDTFSHAALASDQINLIIEKEGASANEPYVLIISHYDTKNGPGVNDNGTGVSASMIMAKIIRDIPTRYNIRFIHFGAEENGLLGSEHYVQNTLNKADSIRVVLNLDQLGGEQNGTNNNLIVCERDEDSDPNTNNLSSWFHTDTMSSLIELYTDLNTTTGKAFASDYIPFEEAGYVITGLWQYDGLTYPFYHSPSDSLKHVDTTTTIEVTKGALATLLHFAQGEGHVGLNSFNDLYSQLSMYPNPAANQVYLNVPITSSGYDVQIIDMQGRIVQKSHLASNEKIVNLAVISGIYTVVVVSQDNDERYRGRLVIQ